ncbi:hypothetical protein M408DRAFT_22336 [Serendipita vermifera MAFF 305830]|uniref:F-box domain-containing protein n=1 Tax=Serendipita vermifera MAFF 305830 TaxID=933852 RepID=A0A0C3B0Q0_SERVB|nr:hypothetical protein M408DRAFT_22336 [Serendipita vermifera MAFF 305830]
MPDPISVLPPEVAWRCIYEALPRKGEIHHDWYPSALLQLATVSRPWEDLILSTSSFWVEVHVHNRAEDMLATLATFLALSRERELSLVIWTFPGDEWDHVRELLLPHAPRVRTLTILSDNETGAMFHGEPIHTLLLASSVIIKYLNLAPFLKELDFDRECWIDPPELESLTLPSQIKVKSCIRNAWNKNGSNHRSFEHFTDITIVGSFADIAPSLSSFTSLSTLSFVGSEDSIERSPRKSIIPAGPPHLKVIESGEKFYCPDLGRIITLTAAHLLSLDVMVTCPDIEEILGILPLLTTLQSLALSFYGRKKVSDTSSTVPRIVMSCLRTLFISGYISPAENRTSFDGLFAAFIVLYPNVTNVFLTLPIYNMGASYLQSLQRLESMVHYMSAPQGYSQLFLPTLQELAINDPEDLQFIKAPNLIKLRMHRLTSNEDLEPFLPCKLQSLEIRTSGEDATTLILPSTALYEVRRLSFELYPSDRWTLTPLPLLASIRFDYRHLAYPSGMNPQGNMLCVQLIYHPEMCPSLREIDFGEYVEWDLLFIMLKQRNLGRNDVSRIEKVFVPFVPFAFRQSLLDLLLGQERQDGPSNMILSLEETREVVCDPSMYVTLVCERHRFNEIKVQDA